MKKTICAFMFLGLIAAYASVYAQKEEKITVTTYYPSPTGVYQTIRLTPSPTPPADARPGQLYYNSTTDKIMYYNNSRNWTNITAGAAGNGTEHVDPISSFSGTPVAGDIYFNNVTNQILYFNKAGKWVSIGGTGYWTEGALVPRVTTPGAEEQAYYPRYLVNATMRRVGIGTNTPKATLSVYQAENSGSNENVTIANFTRFFTTNSKSQAIAISLYPNGTGASPNPSYMDSTSLIYVPQGNLHIAAANEAKNITFNVGGYSSSATEVMALRNVGPEGDGNVRVGIGNSTPPFALFVDSKTDNTTAFGVRSSRFGLKSGIATITPYQDAVWLTMGFYLQNGVWKHDAHEYPNPGVWSRQGAALVIRPSEGVHWYYYNAANLTSGNTIVSGWAGNWTLWNTTANHTLPSSRALKENFTPLDPEDFLRKIDQLEVTRWNFKAEGTSVKHIGPVAEDFTRIFALGTDERSISMIDEVGVSLAGIKALSGKIKTQQKKIKELQAELKYLESQFSRRQ
jgi:hypothetical protein